MDISEQEARLETIFLFTHSNRIKCLIKDITVSVNGEEKEIKETLNNKEYFNNITFHIKKNNHDEYEITVVDTGSLESKGNKIGNNELELYRDAGRLKYLKISNHIFRNALLDNKYQSIIISRHGQGRHNKKYLGVTDARLTDKGIKDTESTALRVKKLIPHLQPSYVFTSELFRTMQTAAIFMKALNFSKTPRNFYIVRCNHELSGDQIKNKPYICNTNLDDTLKDTSLFDKLKSIRGEENYPKRLYENMELNGLNEGGIVKITSEELNCSIKRYRKTCKKGSEMFNNINIVFNIYNGKENDCKDYAVFRNIKANIDNIKANIDEEEETLGGGPKRNSMKKKKTILRKSKRFTKKRNKRRTNKKKRLTKKRNSRRTNKRRFTKRR